MNIVGHKIIQSGLCVGHPCYSLSGKHIHLKTKNAVQTFNHNLMSYERTVTTLSTDIYGRRQGGANRCI